MNRKEVTKVVAASLLGDANISKEYKPSARFSLTQLPEHSDHVNHIAEYLETITRVRFNSTEPKKTVICGKNTVSNGTYRVTTMNHPFYVAFYNRMYGTGRKAIDPHYLTLIDWHFIAIWYMQDGSRGSKAETLLRSPLFCTDCFSYGDVLLIRQACIERLGLILNIRKNKKFEDGTFQYRMYVPQKQVLWFVDNIRAFMQPSFTYKLDVL